MNCDRIAAWYQWLEYAAFGNRLQRHRLFYLDAVQKCRRALVLGDGDGRFLLQLALGNRLMEIDSIEASSRMLELAAGRLNSHGILDPERIRLIRDDATSVAFPCRRYDLVVTNFFLDCFTDEQVESLAGKVAAHVVPGTFWVVSEFHKPPKGWRAVHADLWLKSMYLFFRFSTRLQTRRLPPWRDSLAANEFTLKKKFSSFAGLVVSELWQFSAANEVFRAGESQSPP